MKKQILTSLFSLVIMAASFGQIPNYNDVGVIVNDNSQVSIDIANYFKQARNIPEVNMIHIQTVTDEIIDTTEFRNIQYQIKNYILQNNLQDQLNYLVTTKGVPFNIEVDSCSYVSPLTFMKCSSVESELTLLLSADSAKILLISYFSNPYYGSSEHFSRAEYDLFLVSRLDGKTKQEVFDLIDKSGPGSYVNKEFGQFIFDISYLSDTNSIFDLFSGMMYPAIDTLASHGWNAVFHGDTLVPTNEDHVLGYVGLIRKSFHGSLDFNWEKGSFCEFIATGPEFTFYDSLNYDGNIQMADVIGEGCASGSGYVHATYGSQITDYATFFGRYTMERSDPYNLAESYYMAAKPLSWMNVLVGDPKTTITTQGGSSVADFKSELDVHIYPNPAHNQLTVVIDNSLSSPVSVSIIDQMGKVLLQSNVIPEPGRNEINLDVSSIPAGFYFVGIRSETAGFGTVKKLMIVR